MFLCQGLRYNQGSARWVWPKGQRLSMSVKLRKYYYYYYLMCVWHCTFILLVFGCCGIVFTQETWTWLVLRDFHLHSTALCCRLSLRALMSAEASDVSFSLVYCGDRTEETWGDLLTSPDTEETHTTGVTLIKVGGGGVQGQRRATVNGNVSYTLVS